MYKLVKGLVNPEAFFKNCKFKKYFLKKSNVIDFDALITQIFVKICY